jgi:signal transduction histidine kinase
MKNLKIFSKIFFAYTIIGLLSVATLSIVFFDTLKRSLIERTIDQLSSINILKKNHVDNYFSRTEKNLIFLLRKKDYVKSYSLLNSKSDLPKEEIQHLFQEVSEINDIYDYANISIFDTSFQKIYSSNGDTAYHKIILSQNMLDCKSCLQKPFNILDLSVFNPAKNAMIVYMMPLVAADGSIKGYMVIKEKIDKLQNILYERSGMGNTGESYFVGGDFYMRSASRFFPDKPPVTITVKTDAVQNALDKINNENIIEDYRGQKVLSVYRTLSVADLNWVLITEMDYHEAIKPVDELKPYFLGIGFLIMLLILVLTYFVSSAISRPILYLKDIILNLSKGVITKEELRASSNDEIGQITKATNQLIQGMNRTTDFAYQIGAGNFNASYTTLSDKDSLGFALITMRDELKSLTERQVRLVREKSAALIEGQEMERRRIVMELHDGVGQLLTVVKLRMEMIEGQDALKQEVRNLVNDTIAEVRRISYNVMPSSIVDFGLEAALNGLCGNIRRIAQFVLDFKYVKEHEESLNFEISIAVFRIVQEGLNNIVKHSKATKVNLYVVEGTEYIYIVLKDNGSGFIKENTMNKGGFGLNGMKERAKLLEGDLSITSEVGQGTTIEIQIPLSREQL